jgi:hypothetical protein
MLLSWSGQIIGISIYRFKNFTDIHKYLRLLEESIILATEYGLDCGAYEGRLVFDLV